MKNILTFIFIACASMTYAQKIRLKVEGQKDTTVFLIKYFGSRLNYADTAQMKNGVVFFDGKKQLWNNTHDVTIKNFEVELYVQDIDEPHVSSGVYSVLHNEWVVNPSPNKEDIDEDKILEKGVYFAKQIDSLINTKTQNEDTIKQINSLKDKIKKFRQSGLEKGGEYSYENLTFKLLRRNGYIKKLMDLKNTITDKKLSLR